jgi:hypothetical protein
VKTPMLDPDRAVYLANRIKGSGTKTEYVSAWPRSDKDLPAVEIPVEWVRFSTLNHRTRAEQDRVAMTHGRQDLFTADPLGDEAQDEQYRILCHQEGFTELKADVLDRGQQEPAIITADGILINGNRRAAALRSLFESNHLNFQYIRCLVLPPDATTDEIVDLEAELQIARDFKQEYSWVNEALLIQELYDREDKNFERVAARMHRKVGEVRDLYEKIQQAQQLAAMSQGTRYLVDFVDNESAFDELAKYIRNKSPREADDARSVYFLGTLAGVEYRTLRHLRRPDAVNLVRREIRKDPATEPLLKVAQPPAASDAGDDLLDDVLGPSEPSSSLSDLLGFVATKATKENISLPDGGKISVSDVLQSLRSTITAAAHEAEEENKDQATLSAPLERVGKAITELHRAYTQLPRSRALPDWDEAAFRAKVSLLESHVAKLKAVK